jgi:hypothetical protein
MGWCDKGKGSEREYFIKYSQHKLEFHSHMECNLTF